jgi:hypothetical protein
MFYDFLEVQNFMFPWIIPRWEYKHFQEQKIFLDANIRFQELNILEYLFLFCLEFNSKNPKLTFKF